ncbi:MAG: ABC transporter ATP-binding protein/permease [Cyclobacteriaceae bacterium]|nr:ABC transporter ATP-binding protein [Cyclobacteriaceae bacterium]MCH8516932.1 ABC transporter ATP-binding protein/permease [Cyclobacteriaceae bacterium]
MKQKLKSFIAKHFSDFTYFYRYLGYRIFIAVALSIGVGVLDGFGLAMFLPLLQMVGEEGASAEGMGNLRFLVDGMEAMGIPLSMFSALGFMVFFFIMKGVFKYYSTFYRIVLMQFFVRKLRLNTLKGINQINFNYFVTADVGRIQNTMTGEVDRVARAFANYFGAFQQMVLVVVYLLFAIYVDAQFALLVALGGGLTNILYNTIYKRTKGESKRFTKGSHEYQGQVIQHIGHFKYLKATALVNAFGEQLKSSIQKIEHARRMIGKYSAILQSAREPMLIGVVAAVIILQTQILGGSLGVILISLLFFYRALTALTQMQTLWNKYLEVSGSMENVTSFQAELKAHKGEDGTQDFGVFESALQLKDVSFAYGDEQILQNITLHIEKNKTYAFVGESGSGKTTLVNVLAGLLKPAEGTFLLDEKDSKELKIASYQARIGYITQEPVVFNDSIFANVSFFAEATAENRARFEQACRQAAIWDYIQTLPNKENTQLGNNGINLSGGQKQRISIARELYKDIDILIMDEATSALDTETEKIIQDQIEAIKGQYTLLIVAHRLSTVRTADEVIFMRQGEIVEQATFAQLINKVPEFKKMVELQEI